MTNALKFCRKTILVKPVFKISLNILEDQGLDHSHVVCTTLGAMVHSAPSILSGSTILKG